MERDIASVGLFPGIDDALRRLSEAGKILAVVTSNSQANVLRVLGPQNAARFHHFECGASIFGKRFKLRKVLAASQVPPDGSILVGDEVRDAKAAAQASVSFGAVAWGYTHLDALIDHGANETFASAKELSAKLV